MSEKENKEIEESTNPKISDSSIMPENWQKRFSNLITLTNQMAEEPDPEKRKQILSEWQYWWNIHLEDLKQAEANIIKRSNERGEDGE